MLEKFSKNRTLIERITLHIWRSKFYRDYFKTEKEKIENKTIKYIHLVIGFIIFIFVFFLEDYGFKFNFERVSETQLSDFLDDNLKSIKYFNEVSTLELREMNNSIIHFYSNKSEIDHINTDSI